MNTNYEKNMNEFEQNLPVEKDWAWEILLLHKIVKVIVITK